MSTPQRPLPLTAIRSAEETLAPSRRQFCAHACQAASLVAVGVFLPACGGGDGGPTSPSSATPGSALPVLSGSVSGRTVTVPVAAGGPLAAAGGTALVTASIQPASFVVFRASDTSFNVMTAICTHEGCTVEHFDGQLFVCPCHGSRYTTSGTVSNGPATRALQSFPSSFANGSLTFTV